mmetsp:Transcript_5127/g.11644  ORF Transcript_5127/g.11644 Transcript_5127/m.11644 type:complete len:105 (+) Transcript_5127:887-1201(+)
MLRLLALISCWCSLTALLPIEIAFVKLHSDASAPEVDDPATVMGWGATHISDDISDLAEALQHVEVKVISNGDCNARDENNTLELEPTLSPTLAPAVIMILQSY